MGVGVWGFEFGVYWGHATTSLPSTPAPPEGLDGLRYGGLGVRVWCLLFFCVCVGCCLLFVVNRVLFVVCCLLFGALGLKLFVLGWVWNFGLRARWGGGGGVGGQSWEFGVWG